MELINNNSFMFQQALSEANFSTCGMTANTFANHDTNMYHHQTQEPFNRSCIINASGLLTPPPTPEVNYNCNSPNTSEKLEAVYQPSHQFNQPLYNQSYPVSSTFNFNHFNDQTNGMYSQAAHYDPCKQTMLPLTHIPQQQQHYFDNFYEKQCANEKMQNMNRSDHIGRISRTSHNMLERVRRQNMKARLSHLRSVIPELSKHDKAPKIQILLKAIKHIRQLNINEEKLMVDKELEIQKKNMLEMRLKNLSC